MNRILYHNANVFNTFNCDNIEWDSFKCEHSSHFLFPRYSHCRNSIARLLSCLKPHPFLSFGSPGNPLPSVAPPTFGNYTSVACSLRSSAHQTRCSSWTKIIPIPDWDRGWKIRQGIQDHRLGYRVLCDMKSLLYIPLSTESTEKAYHDYIYVCTI